MKRRYRTHLWTLFAAFAFCLVLLPTAMASATVDTMYIGVDTTLTENHNGQIVVVADDATLDCAGFSVIGGEDLDGISVDFRTNVTIKNCVVSGWGEGIDVYESSGVRIENVTVTGNLVNGIGISHSDDVLLVGNNAVDNPGRGLQIAYSEGVEAVQNISTGNIGDGIRVWDSEDVIIEDNTLDGNGNNGLVVFLAGDLTATGNSCDENGNNGIAIYSSEAVLVEGNHALDNAVFGFKIRRTTNSSFLRNRADGNEDGFHIGEVDSTLFFKNKAMDNTAGFTVWREDPRFLDSANNTFVKNKALKNDLFGYLDDLAGQNTYDKNVCDENGAAGSIPSGLCIGD